VDVGQNFAHHGLIIAGCRRILIAGTGLTVTSHRAVRCADRGHIERAGREVRAGSWVGGRWLSGDETHQGRHVRIAVTGMQRVRLYRY
jgi:hypothetical protein